MSRTASTPPQIPGFDHLGLLGSGGFADVFLYRQHRPRREVAVKVLLAEGLGPDAHRAFEVEADLMAQLSSHPAIVTIHSSGTAPDGRPYLVMEHCSRPNLGARFRAERFPVAEALRIGVLLSGAVETTHRAGILHRDIKPANVLVTQFGVPALTDFGISATTDTAGTVEGLSIPWSPPESFDEPQRSGVTSDVWALAATLHSLLAGRSPFEQPGGANSGADLVRRIQQQPLPPTGRPDVPELLEGVLRTAMAKDPESRYGSAHALGRALQQVQTVLSLSVTPIDVLDDALPPGEEVHDDDGGTRIRPVSVIHPGAVSAALPGGTMPRVRPGPAPVLHDPGPHRVAPVPVEDTQLRDTRGVPTGPAPARGPAPAVPVRRRGPVLVAAAAGVVLLVAAAVGGVVLLGGPSADQAQAVTTAPVGPRATLAEAAPADLVREDSPSPTDVVGTPAGTEVVFTWTNPAPEAGDRYQWGLVVLAGEPELSLSDEPTVTVPASVDGRTCLQVSLVRANGRVSETPTVGCVP